MASDAGLEPLKPPIDLDKARAELKAAGYNNERVVLLVPTDYVTLKAMADVAADTMKSIGMNVDYVATDWGNMLQRRNNKGPVEQGGWVLLRHRLGRPRLVEPRRPHRTPRHWRSRLARLVQGSQARNPLPGLAQPPRTSNNQKTICQDIQREAMDQVPYFPLGQYMQPTAYRTRLSGINDGFATFWNIAPVS